jgi:hypothetical protein
MNRPIPRSSVSERFCAVRLVTFSGHTNALRAARRKARDRIPVSRCACLASSSAMSVFDITSENRFGLLLQGRLNRWWVRLLGPDAHFLPRRDFNNDA